MSCDLRVTHPLDADLSLTTTDTSVEFYYGAARVYRNLSDIAAWIAGTDPAAAADGNNGVLFLFKSDWSLTGSTYTITDNTSVGCITVHRGTRTHIRALNGDTYTFDTMAGMPRFENTFSVLSTTRRAGNDVTGIDPTDGHSYENNFWKDPDVQTDDAACGYWTTQASVDNAGAVTFLATFTAIGLVVPGTTVIGPHSSSPVRWKYKTVFKDFTSDSSTITNIVKGLPNPAIAPVGLTGVSSVGTFEGIATTPTFPPPHVCQGDVNLTYTDPSFGDYDFDIDARSDAPGSYTSFAPPAPYISAATYVQETGAFRANFATEMTSTATVGIRSNPGGQNCSRCYTVEFTETDGDTAAVTTIFSGEVFQAMGARVGPGIDPRTLEGWVSETTWRSRGVYPSISVYRQGPELWIAEVLASPSGSTMIYNLKGLDCLEEIEDVEAYVTEVKFWTTTGSGTVADPTIRGGSTRLKIDTRSFVATASTCTECLDDPCEEPCEPATITAYNTAEVTGSGLDFEWEMETSNGSGVFTNAVVLTSYPGSYAAPPDTDVAWIGIDATAAPPVGTRIFRTEVICTGTQDQIDARTLEGTLGVDDEIGTISVNGVVVLSSVGGTFTTFSTFIIPGTALTAGTTNTIDFELINPGAIDAAGLLVKWTNDDP